jgi:hypothetical protein
VNDNELIELAAQAAGITLGEWVVFNPLVSYSDAMQLVVKMRLCVEWQPNGRVVVYSSEASVFDSSCQGGVDADIRRAITCAAALLLLAKSR